MRRIFIKGNGPTACIFLCNFLDRKDLTKRFTIVLPKDWQFTGGPGYQNVNATLLMNSRPIGDSILVSNSDDCLNYMGNNEYPTRKKYKEYMQSRCLYSVQILKDRGILLYDDPKDDDLFLLTPGFQKRYPKSLIDNAVYDFYSDLGLLKNAKGKILVLGMGLCAVDAITEILRNKNDTEIDCYSRSGIWPRSHNNCVSSPIGGELLRLPIKSAFGLSKTLDKICEINGCDQIWSGDQQKYFRVVPPGDGHNATSIAATFRHDMYEIWKQWGIRERQEWIEKYDHLYKKSRTGMSVPNAKIMYEAFRDKRISSVRHIDKTRYDLIIDATGYKPKNIQMPYGKDTVVVCAPMDNPFVYPSISQSRREIKLCFQRLGR